MVKSCGFGHEIGVFQFLYFSLASDSAWWLVLFEKNSRFAHFGEKLSKIGHLAGCWILVGCWNSWKSQKNLKVGVFETDFKQVPFVFLQTTCTYSES